MVSSIWLILFFIVPTILDLFVAPTIAQDDGPCTQAAEYCWKCSDTAGSYTNGIMYQQNLYSLLSSFSSSITTQNSGFYNYSLGDDHDKVNAIALCRGDLRHEDCRSCVSESTQILLRNCSNHKEAILWARPCMVRYSQNLIFGVKEEDSYKYLPSKDNPSNAEAFGLVLIPLLEILSDKAALGDFREKFAAGHATVPGGETIYALVQCTPDIDKENCSNCLKNSISAIPGDQGVLMQGARVLKPSCNIRYEVNMFYESAADSLVNVSAPVTPSTLAPVTLSKKTLLAPVTLSKKPLLAPVTLSKKTLTSATLASATLAPATTLAPVVACDRKSTSGKCMSNSSIKPDCTKSPTDRSCWAYRDSNPATPTPAPDNQATPTPVNPATPAPTPAPVPLKKGRYVAAPVNPPTPAPLPPKKAVVAPTATTSGDQAKSKSGKVIGLIVGGCIILVVGMALFWFIFWKKSEGGDKNAKELDDEFEKGIGPRKFSYTKLAQATSDFAEQKKLGEGGFGWVYKGFIKESNSCVAVKRVQSGSKQGLKEYAAEVTIISRLRHRNLVQLIGWCHENGQLILVYEFMPNGSLDSHLFNGKSLLIWEVRYKIAQDLASGLLYLHQGWEQCVLHRDIKSSNVMLDSNFNAKLGDFGLARLVDHGKPSQTTVVAGTQGYMAIEYVTSRKASKKTDIYSFGVVALEIACGRKPVVEELESNQVVMVDWVWELYGRGKVIEAADPKLRGYFDEEQMKCLMIVGLWCAHPNHVFRPSSIMEAIQVLNFNAPLPSLPLEMPEATSLHRPPSSYGTNTSERDKTNSSSFS